MTALHGSCGFVVNPKYNDTALTSYVREAAATQGIVLFDTGLALLYWDQEKVCRAFILTEDSDVHFTVEKAAGLYRDRSEIVPLSRDYRYLRKEGG